MPRQGRPDICPAFRDKEGAIDTDELASGLRLTIGLLVRQLRQLQIEDELTMPETSALARLDRLGPITAAALARHEQISPQSVGVT